MLVEHSIFYFHSVLVGNPVEVVRYFSVDPICVLPGTAQPPAHHSYQTPAGLLSPVPGGAGRCDERAAAVALAAVHLHPQYSAVPPVQMFTLPVPVPAQSIPATTSGAPTWADIFLWHSLSLTAGTCTENSQEGSTDCGVPGPF